MDNLPQAFRTVISQELCEGEKPVWVAQPTPPYFLKHPIVCVPFMFVAALILAETVNQMNTLWGLEYHVAFAIVAVPLCVVFSLCSPFFVRSVNKLLTVYVITDQRAIVFAGDSAAMRRNLYSMRKNKGYHQITSHPLKDLGDLECNEKADGSGDIPAIGFMNIPNVRNVEILLKQHKNQSQTTRAI